MNPMHPSYCVDQNPDIDIAEHSPVDVHLWLHQVDGSAFGKYAVAATGKDNALPDASTASNHVDAQKYRPFGSQLF
jgi:hypothetical protein